MSAASARKAIRPNAARRNAYRIALKGRPCGTCGEAVAFDGLSGRASFPGTAHLAHTVAIEVCERYDPEVIFLSCATCNTDANYAGIVDVTADVISEPYSLLPQKIVDAIMKEWVCESAENLSDATTRRNARKARGIAW